MSTDGVAPAGVTESVVADRPDARGPGLRATIGVFVGFLFIIALWSLATPRFASPDEPAHVFRAYGVAHGQVYVASRSARGGGRIDVPRWLTVSNPGCFAFKPNITAACVRNRAVAGGTVSVFSGAARYDPLYYFFVGLPSLAARSQQVVFFMRIVSAALTAWMLAWAVTSAATLKRPRIAVATVLFAVTPMTLFLAGSVNPNGLEISAAIAVWVNGLILVRSDRPELRSLLLRRTAIAACLLVVERTLSPVWFVVIAIGALLAARSGLRQRLLRRDVVPWAILVFLAGVAAVAWIVLSKSLSVSSSRQLHHGLGQRLGDAWNHQRLDWKQEIGIFGWLDTRMPNVYYLIWAAVGGVGAVAALLLIRWRDRIALCAVTVLAVGLPVVAEAESWNRTGPLWQGRYSLPLTVGIPLVAAVALSEAKWLPKALEWTLSAIFMIATGGIGIVAFVVALHRYVDGMRAALTLRGPWQPRFGAEALAITQLTLTATALVLALLFADRLSAAGARRTAES
jgi:hypothetical protein